MLYITVLCTVKHSGARFLEAVCTYALQKYNFDNAEEGYWSKVGV